MEDTFLHGLSEAGYRVGQFGKWFNEEAFFMPVCFASRKFRVVFYRPPPALKKKDLGTGSICVSQPIGGQTQCHHA